MAGLAARPLYLFRFDPALLAIALASEGFFSPPLLTGLQVERMPLDLFDDIFLLHLALEPAKGAFQRFTVLHNNFCQIEFTSLSRVELQLS